MTNISKPSHDKHRKPTDHKKHVKPHHDKSVAAVNKPQHTKPAKPKHQPKAPARKTKMVMTKMGPIEMIVSEKEKKGLLGKVKSLFGK